MHDRTLPDIRTSQAFEAVRRDEGVLRPGVDAVLERHGHTPSSARRFADGSLPVYAVGDDLVLKLYPPLYAEERDHEAVVLRAIEGRLGVPTPVVQETGELDGWAYLFMTRLRGQPLAETWAAIAPHDQLHLAEQLGQALAALHGIIGPDLADLQPSWPGFFQKQRLSATERQRANDLGEPWLDQIEGYLERVGLEPGNPSALLHTEIMREHLFVERTTRGWRLSGLFDFEPAMLGASEYEFAAVGLFFSCGDRAILRRVLEAYGYAPERLNGRLSERLLAWALHHRYSHLPWYLERMPPPENAKRLEDLARLWFGLDR
jgi:hygromycin-B 7''-O-kinase